MAQKNLQDGKKGTKHLSEQQPKKESRDHAEQKWGKNQASFEKSPGGSNRKSTDTQADKRN